MSGSKSKLVGFLRELKQRRVYHAAAVYAAAAFVLMQLVDLLVEALNLPSWILTIAVLAAVLGFVPALLLSWAFDLGPVELGHARADDRPAMRAAPTRLAIAAAIVLGLIGAAIFSSRRLPAPVVSDPTIAVLPFRNLSGVEDEEYFADGIAEDLLTSLAAVPGLHVISRSSVMQYKHSEKDARQIAAELGVGWLLEGSVQRAPSKLRITARLVDAKSGGNVWAEVYDRDPRDLFAVQSEIAERIAQALRLELTSEVRERLAQVPTENFAAHDLALRGREYLNRFDHESNELAIQFARRSIALDPGYAPGYALLGSAFANRMRFGAGPEWGDSALSAGQRAIVLDPGLGEGYRTLGVAFFRLGRYPEALQAYERAAALNPSDQRAIASAGAVYSFQGQALEALDWTRRAIAIDPRSPDIALLYHNVVVLYLDMNMTLNAERALERARELDPEHPKLPVLATEIAFRRGDWPQAIALTDTLISRAPTDPYAHLLAGDAHLFAADIAGARRLYLRANGLAPEAEGVRHYAPVLLAWTLMLDGERDEAMRLLTRFEDFARDEIGKGSENYTLFFSMAASRTMRGDTAGALEWLDRANATAGAVLEWALANDPLLESIRATPRFRQIQASVTATASSLRTQVLEQER